MALHNLLRRQLKRLNLNKEHSPSIEQWNAILATIHRTYIETDQERYLLERSMEISSLETSELNEKLVQAQHIAHLGYWQYEREIGSIMFSKEMYLLFGLSPEKPIPSYEELINRFDNNEKNIISNLVDRAFDYGENYEFEAKFRTFMNEFRWCFIAGKPEITTDNTPIRRISGIMIDITMRKKGEEEMNKLNKDLIQSARRAGMAEVATSVLHNVGNILNSVNVSVGLIQQEIQRCDINSIVTVMSMINDNLNNFQNYLINDPKGKLLPIFLLEAKKQLEINFKEIDTEINRLIENIKHINNIVALQSSLSGISDFTEEIVLSNIIDNVINLNFESFEKFGIILEKNFEKPFILNSDKNKIMQVVVNLIQNAKDSVVIAHADEVKKISIQTKIQSNNKYIDVIVTDNGVGIAPENLTHIFSFGYTTKPTGHGFGLHSSALLAKDLGGSLHAESQGIGLGARFILTLPLSAERRKAYA